MASKPKPPLSAWLIEHRKARGDSVADTARVVDRSEATVRGWEAGRPPSADDPSIMVLERYYGAVAPKNADGQSDLALAIREQATAIAKMTEAINVAALAVLTSQASIEGGQVALGDLLARLAAGETLTELARSLQNGPGR